MQTAGIQAQTVASPTGQADCTLLTEGFADTPAAMRHWQALSAARLAKDTHILLLQSAAHLDPSQTSGMAGLGRTLSAEWPGTHLRSLTLHTHDPDGVANLVHRALPGSTGEHIVSTPDGFVSLTLGAPLTPPPQQRQHNAGVWLITGGGRGVTAACAMALSKRTSGTFLLAGRSPLIDWPNDIPKTLNQSELIGLIARNRPGNTPAQLRHIARALIHSHQVQHTMSTIRANDARAEYTMLDVSDAISVGRAMQALQFKHGPISGVIHGAGVLADRRADDKTRSDFETVFAPKVDGFHNLLAHLDKQTLTHIGVFSSASAIFGNPGQADYAAANDILNQIVESLARNHSHLHARSFAWGPWEGGMVTPHLATQFKTRGISLIPVQEGARIFVDQMLSAHRHPVQLCIGDDWTQ